MTEDEHAPDLEAPAPTGDDPVPAEDPVSAEEPRGQDSSSSEAVLDPPHVETTTPTPKKRGRPVGSKNKAPTVRRAKARVIVEEPEKQEEPKPAPRRAARGVHNELQDVGVLPPRQLEFSDFMREHLRDLQTREQQRRNAIWEQVMTRYSLPRM